MYSEAVAWIFSISTKVASDENTPETVILFTCQVPVYLIMLRIIIVGHYGQPLSIKGPFMATFRVLLNGGELPTRLVEI